MWTHRGCELEPHRVSQLGELEKVVRVAIGDRDTEADVFAPDLAQLEECAHPVIEAVLQSTKIVIGRRKSLDADAKTEIRELTGECDHALGEVAVGGDDDAVGLGTNDLDDLWQVFTKEGFSAGDVHELERRQGPEICRSDLLGRR